MSRQKFEKYEVDIRAEYNRAAKIEGNSKQLWKKQ
jgi:hypothetical protein